MFMVTWIPCTDSPFHTLSNGLFLFLMGSHVEQASLGLVIYPRLSLTPCLRFPGARVKHAPSNLTHFIKSFFPLETVERPSSTSFL